MPALREDGITSMLATPLNLVRGMFDAANQPAEDRTNDWGVEDYFTKMLSDPITREQIPLLAPGTVENIPHGGLCRYHGMVLDTLDPEYYVGAFRQPGQAWQTTKYSDCSLEVAPDAQTVVWERRPLYCGRVPGEAAWVLPATAAAHAATSNPGSSMKRNREEDITDEALVKREREEKDNDEAMEEDAEGQEKPDATVGGGTGNSPAAPDLLAPQEGDCIVYVYEREEESLRLNNVAEFVGILSRVPEPSNFNTDGMDTFMEEELAARPPPSRVPRLHALAALKRNGTEDLSIITYKGSAERQAQVAELREACLEFLQAALGGDRLAAEYILLQLVSRIYSRTEAGALGLLSLGLTKSPPGSASDASLGSPGGLSHFGQALASAVGSLTPRSLGLPVTVDQLNKRSWRPSRDVKSNRLTRSPLQLADTTQLILDETLLQAGQLTGLGVRNLQTLKDLLDNKRVEYEFSFYTLPINAEVAVTVLSEGKPLLGDSLDVIVPLQPTMAFKSVEEIQAMGQGPLLSSVRAYLGVARQLDLTIDDSLTSFLENQLVEERKKNKELDPSTMHSWLTVARLIALSHGCDTLTEGHWAEMKRLEHAREQRIRSKA